MKKHVGLAVAFAFLLAAQPAMSQTKKTAKKSPSTQKPVVAEGESSQVTAPAPKGTKARRPPLDPSKTVRIEYTNLRWNLDSTQSESAAVVLKDTVSGRSVNVQLYETAPDSGQFRGYYNITWGSAVEVQPEIYVPTQPVRDEADALTVKRLFEMKNMRRLPFILRKGERDEQLVEVFNTKQEAVDALDSYKSVAESKIPPKDTIAAKALLEAAELAKLEAMKRKEAEETASREAERRKMEEAERRKAEELRKQQEAISAAERERRKKLALKHSSQAMDLFRAGQFVEAEDNFRKAYELDPSNKSFYFGYGVTLFRNNKHNESLVILKLATEGDFAPAERDFFIGLNHLKLKEYPQALHMFQKAKAGNHPQISPSAAFYEGVVHFNELRYEVAKVSFQEVLDTSNDPKLDQSAEDYIEKIEGILYFIKNKEKQYFISLSTGMQYDSNVLLVNTSDTSTGTATDVGDSRTILGAGFEYRPIYTKVHEFSAKIKTDMIFSQKSANVLADPFQYSLKFPYKYKGMLWGKGYKMELVAGYEVLHLDVNSSGANQSFFAAVPEKENYLNSLVLDWSNTRVMSDDWFTSYNLKLRSDAVGSGAGSSATGDNDPGAFKINFVWNNMWFMNKKKTQAWIADVGLTQNSSNGKNLSYFRYDIGGTYMFPWVWDLTGAANLTYYNASYSQRTPSSRQDSDIAATFNLIKPINEWLKATAGLGYTTNESNVTSSKYNKYTATLLLAGDWSF